MKKNYDADNTKQLIEKYNISQFFDNMDLPFYIIEYEKGELLQSPNDTEDLFQIGISGEVSVYHIRDDGEKYFLSQSSGLFKLGSIEVIQDTKLKVYAEALTDTTVIALSLNQCRSILRRDVKFLNVLLYEMSHIITLNMNYKVITSTLSERVINYLKYHCTDHIMHGVEKTAYKLHCSDRQLQRVLNDLEGKEKIKKCGKGTYALSSIKRLIEETS